MLSALARWLRKPRPSAPPSPVPRPRLGVEPLDDRLCPTVTYHGGALLQHVEAQAVYLGSAWAANAALGNEATQYEGFLQTLVGGGYMDMLTAAGYGVGRGSRTPGVVHNAALPGTVTDAQIRNYLQADLTAGSLAAPTANRLYLVFVQPNVVVQQGAGESVHDFLGYHTAFTGTYAGHSVAVRYAVMAYPDGSVHNAIVPGLTPFQSQTKVVSHELVEAVTDPDVGYSTLGWYDDQYDAENGDLANTKFGTYNGYVVQYQVDQQDRYIFPTATTPTSTPGTSFNAANFAGHGLWRYGTGWQQLTGVDARAIGVNAYGDVVASFDGYGTWEYVESRHTWMQLSTNAASAVAIDDYGDVVGEYAGAGVWRYEYGGGWTQLTQSNASLLAMGADGQIAAEFGGHGVWRIRPGGGWVQLTTTDASILEIDANGNVLGEFVGHGVWRYRNGPGWQNLTPSDATDLGFDHLGNVSGVFAGYGTWLFTDATGGWAQVSSVAAFATVFDSKGYLVAAFTGYGLWRYTADRGWVQLTAAEASLLL